MTVFLFLMASLPVCMIEGLDGIDLHSRETGYGDFGYMEHEIAVFNLEEQLSPWVSYPLFFNPAKSCAAYSEADGTLEVTSQLPYSADYTYAWYLVEPDWNLTLHDEGEGDYYGGIRREIESLLEQGEFYQAQFRAMEIMYPGSMPDTGELCVRFVVSAAEMGTLEAFDLAGHVSLNLCGVELFQLENESPEYLQALEKYASVSDQYTADLVRERLERNE